MPLSRGGRPRARGKRERIFVEIDAPLYACVTHAAAALPEDLTIRAIIEEGLRLWLVQHGASLPSGASGEEPGE